MRYETNPTVEMVAVGILSLGVILFMVYLLFFDKVPADVTEINNYNRISDDSKLESQLNKELKVKTYAKPDPVDWEDELE